MEALIVATHRTDDSTTHTFSPNAKPRCKDTATIPSMVKVVDFCLLLTSQYAPPPARPDSFKELQGIVALILFAKKKGA